MGNYFVGSLFYLSHSGIKGQKWGVKRFQNADRTWTDEGKIRYGRKTKGERARSKSETESEPKHYSKENIEELATKFSGKDRNKDDSKEFLWQLTAVTDPIRTYRAVSGSKKAKEFDKEREDETIDETTGFKLKSKPMTEEEDLARVNPEVYNFNVNTKSNCMLCTTAYEMRRRGYDVKAETAAYGYSDKSIKKWFPDAEVKTLFKYDYKKDGIGGSFKIAYGLNEKTIDAAINKMKAEQPDGARGNLMVDWGLGCGHSMAYEIKDGKLRILDGQINKIYSEGSFLNPRKLLRSVYEISYARLDNLDFDPKAIRKCCR